MADRHPSPVQEQFICLPTINMSSEESDCEDCEMCVLKDAAAVDLEVELKIARDQIRLLNGFLVNKIGRNFDEKFNIFEYTVNVERKSESDFVISVKKNK